MYFVAPIQFFQQNPTYLIVQPLDDGGVRTFIADEENPYYQKYLLWVAEGNTAQPWQTETDK